MTRTHVPDDVCAVLSAAVIDPDGVGHDVGPVGLCNGRSSQAKPDSGDELLGLTLDLELKDEPELADVFIDLEAGCEPETGVRG